MYNELIINSMHTTFTSSYDCTYPQCWLVNYVYLQNNNTALMYAAAKGHTDVVQVLLSRQDMDINMRNKVGDGHYTVIQLKITLLLVVTVQLTSQTYSSQYQVYDYFTTYIVCTNCV